MRYPVLESLLSRLVLRLTPDSVSLQDLGDLGLSSAMTSIAFPCQLSWLHFALLYCPCKIFTAWAIVCYDKGSHD